MSNKRKYLTQPVGVETSESRAPGVSDREQPKRDRAPATPGYVDGLDEARAFVNALHDGERGRLLQALLEATTGRTIYARLLRACSNRPGLAAMLDDTLDHWVGA